MDRDLSDQRILSLGVGMSVASARVFKDVAEAGNGAEARKQNSSYKPDVVF
jgi:hypothetical protein